MKPFWITLAVIFVIAILVVIFLGWVGYRMKKAQKQGKAEGIARGKEYLAQAKAAKKSKMPKKFQAKGNAYKKKPKK